MDRFFRLDHRVPHRIPHTRGDGPPLRPHQEPQKAYSPHTWGWTAFLVGTFSEALVFPTHVGMDRIGFVKMIPRIRIPHTRGDGPPNSEN